MNVILNPGEVGVVMSLVTAQLLDTVELSDEAREQVRSWRGDRGPGTEELNVFADAFNDKLAEQVDDATRRRYMRGGRFQRETAAERTS
jgi:hypothetical protein